MAARKKTTKRKAVQTKTVSTRSPNASPNYFKLALSIGICLGAGFIGSFFTMDSISTWYASLNKPFFNPPNWVFGPVWTVLYVFMGWSLYQLWNNHSTAVKKNQPLLFSAYYWFAVQLILNVLWSIIFFGWKNPLLALSTIIFTWFSIGMTVSAFFRIRKEAAYPLLPYWAWVSFASLLNMSIVLLNP
ncbi:MAG: tryptophan-rich sensory protein [Candidatus Diapherotrites archaeon]|uniref:Tryptophan-rich sensory protein n=1 Tax=Candidatus Iainarchaeum sp. TaxID=3101447 RepID=A0A8T4C647_9ARCH|nr:tryptophan-rich sensory protein [Candidatus Diapherotrites archaeon]